MDTLFKIVEPLREDGWYGMEYHGYYVEARLTEEGSTGGLYNTRIQELRLREVDGPIVYEFNDTGVVIDNLDRDHFLRNLANILVGVELYLKEVQ